MIDESSTVTNDFDVHGKTAEPPSMDGLGERLRIAREKKKLSQFDLAQATGVQPATISRYESEAAEPRLSTLIRLVAPLGVSVHYLVTGEREAPPDRMVKPPPGWVDFEKSGEAAFIDDRERAVLEWFGRAAASEGYEPTPQAFSAWLASLRMLPPSATKKRRG